MINLPENHKIKHVAIVMDGNGRWAQERGHKRVWGHVRGSKIVTSIVEEAEKCNVKALTLYAFSTENWSRPLLEIQTLFSLLKKFLLRERKRVLKNNLMFKVIGDISNLPEETQNIIKNLENDSKNNSGLKLTFAFGYGGRTEIVHAVNRFIEKNPNSQLTQDDISHNLFNPLAGDVDLMIRTGGDERISNFLLWQMAYAELFFTKTKWPDFSRKEFREIITTVAARERRFGFVESADNYEDISKKAEENEKVISENRERS